MTLRMRKFLVAFGVIVGAGIVTWLLSWLVQFICSLLFTEAAFSVGNRAVNQLAASTVLAVVVIVIAWAIILEMGGCMLIIVALLVGGAVVSGISWVAARVFVDTPVSNPAAQIVYGVLVVVWSFSLWYIFCLDNDSPEEPEVHVITNLPK